MFTSFLNSNIGYAVRSPFEVVTRKHL